MLLCTHVWRSTLRLFKNENQSVTTGNETSTKNSQVACLLPTLFFVFSFQMKWNKWNSFLFIFGLLDKVTCFIGCSSVLPKSREKREEVAHFAIVYIATTVIIKVNNTAQVKLMWKHVEFIWRTRREQTNDNDVYDACIYKLQLTKQRNSPNFPNYINAKFIAYIHIIVHSRQTGMPCHARPFHLITRNTGGAFISLMMMTNRHKTTAYYHLFCSHSFLRFTTTTQRSRRQLLMIACSWELGWGKLLGITCVFWYSPWARKIIFPDQVFLLLHRCVCRVQRETATDLASGINFFMPSTCSTEPEKSRWNSLYYFLPFDYSSKSCLK